MLRPEVQSCWFHRALLHPRLLTACKNVALSLAGVGRSPMLDTHVQYHLACPPFGLCLTPEEHPPLNDHATLDSLA
jgi:hypothetical protein